MTKKIDLGNTVTRHSLTGGASSIAAVAAIAGYLWVDLEPRVKAAAKEQVEAILVAGDYATSKDVKDLKDRTRDLERKQDRNNAKAEAERKAIKEKIDDTNELIRDVLRMRRRTP